jgi:hypothetical protein
MDTETGGNEMEESSMTVMKILREGTPEMAHVAINIDGRWSEAEFVIFDGCDSGVKFYFELNDDVGFETTVKFFEKLRSLSTEAIDNLVSAKYFLESQDALEEEIPF